MNRLYNRATGNSARQQRILSGFSRMNSRMSRMTDGQSGGSARKFSTAQRMGLSAG